LILVISIEIGYSFCSDDPDNKIKSIRFNPIILRYYQNNNIFGWNGSFSGFSRLSRNFNFKIYTTVNSEMLKYLKDNLWKDTYRLNTTAVHKLSDDLSVNYVLNAMYYYDKQTGFDNDYSRVSIGINPIFLFKDFYISGGINRITDKRMSHQDKGFNFKLSIENENFSLNDYNTNFNTSYNCDYLGNRKNYNFANNITLWRNFTSKSSDTLSVSWNRTRDDYYISADNVIESRRTQIKRIFNNLKYSFSEKIRLSLKSFLDFTNTDIGYPFTEERSTKKRDDFGFRNDLRLFYRDDVSYFSILFGYDIAEQNYRMTKGDKDKIIGIIPFDTPSNKSKKVYFSSEYWSKFSDKDSLGLNFYVEKYSFDTPSEINNDDRDEFRLSFKLENIYKFNSNLIWRLNLDINLSHLVFIYKERSIENNWNRIILLGSGVRYENSNFTIGNFSEIIANYTDYDYEKYLTVVKSFVFRKFNNYTNVNLNLDKKSSINLIVKLEKEENGMLNWSEFVQNVNFSKNNWQAKIMYKYEIIDGLALNNGLEYLSRKYISGIEDKSEGIETRNLEDFGVNLSFEFKSKNLVSVFSLNTRKILRKTGKSLYQTAEIRLNYII